MHAWNERNISELYNYVSESEVAENQQEQRALIWHKLWHNYETLTINSFMPWNNQYYKQAVKS